MQPDRATTTTPSVELPVYARLPVEIVEGRGAVVVTSEGRELLDFYGGHAVALLGYRHPRMLEALAEQARRLFFQTNLVELEVRRRAAATLGRLAPPGLGRVFFVNSGAEANENALRLAFRLTGRSRVVALEGAFHGRTAAAAACTHGSGRWFGFPRAPFEVVHVPPGDAAALEAALTPDVAALLVEAVQGQQGARDLDLDYLRLARNLTADRGAFLIADEVQCGLGRTGRLFAIEEAGVVPDLMTTAKGLAGGFPAGALLAGEAVAASLRPGDLGTTFGGGPLACALMQVVLETLASPGFLECVRRLGELIRQTCQVGPVTGIQGRGLLLGLRTRRPSREVLPELLERGILAGGAGDPMIVRLMPPLILEEAQVAALQHALEDIAP